MANIPLKSIKFPDLADTYTVPSNAGELPYNKSATYPADTVGKALQNIGDSSAPAIIETAQGSIASFDDGADNVPVKDLVAEIVPLQSGSGDPSPDNVRAISGWTECNVSVSGINIWDEEWELGTIGLTSGSKIDDSTKIRSKNYVPVKPNTTYYFKFSHNFRMCFYDENKVVQAGGSTYNPTEIITTPPWARYIMFAVDGTTTYNNDISINYPSTDHDYHAYNGEVHTISFASAGTVYGGRLDVTSGVLVVDRLIKDLGTVDWEEFSSPSQHIFRTNAWTNLKIEDGRYPTSAICTNYDAMGYNAISASDDGKFAIGGSKVVIIDHAYSDASLFETAMNGVTLAYPLITPQTYQLTPTEVKTLLKNNNIWADTGDVTVEYVADTKTFIENLVNA